mmetsp:Transcript_67553/g.188486  ORF Transcript_67553/g.188486 Transcript_67553/m.188486 type:complete len:228 (-) Transcript_67553:1063-1746(-)
MPLVDLRTGEALPRTRVPRPRREDAVLQRQLRAELPDKHCSQPVRAHAAQGGLPEGAAGCEAQTEHYRRQPGADLFGRLHGPIASDREDAEGQVILPQGPFAACKSHRWLSWYVRAHAAQQLRPRGCGVGQELLDAGVGTAAGLSHQRDLRHRLHGRRSARPRPGLGGGRSAARVRTRHRDWPVRHRTRPWDAAELAGGSGAALLWHCLTSWFLGWPWDGRSFQGWL